MDLALAINCRLKFVAAGRPQIFPREHFRIFQQQPPERGEITVARTLPVPAVAHKRFHRIEALPRAFDVNAAVAAFLPAELAEAGRLAGVLPAALGNAERVEQIRSGVPSPT